jgi:hypothetical protein
MAAASSAPGDENWQNAKRVARELDKIRVCLTSRAAVWRFRRHKMLNSYIKSGFAC